MQECRATIAPSLLCQQTTEGTLTKCALLFPKSSYKQSAIFWFGWGTQTENDADVWVGCNNNELYVNMIVFDRHLWHDGSRSWRFDELGFGFALLDGYGWQFRTLLCSLIPYGECPRIRRLRL